MTTFNLEEIYEKLYKQLLLVQGYTEISNVVSIFKACRLKPLKYFNKRSSNIILYRDWFDEFGSSIHINKKKKITVKNNDLTLCRKTIPCTDIYFGLALEKVLAISQQAYIQIGSDDNTNEKQYVITALGIDNYFRSFFFDGTWKRISTLFVDMNVLINIFNRVGLGGFTQLHNESGTIPLINEKEYLTSLPVSRDFIQTIDYNNNQLLDILKKGK